ncbi:PPE family protein PPE34 [Mycobacterium simulans]|uniref:PPE family protein PPE34 n=1 Tax=Mycobacterium simulans TaxID=627089 RepID=A0A7Z7IFF6_9MYCO|nr:PPE family protein PPE34 [Mycobacterium simulans]
MNFAVLPPEVNSLLIYSGAGSEPLLAAAAAWDGLAAELGSAAAAFGSVTSGLAGGVWQGPSSVAMVAAAAPYLGWLSAAAASAESAAGQARAVVSVFEAALAATVDPFVVAANRSQFVSLALSNLFGQNTPAIAAAEFDYELMWAQDVAAMLGYHAGASAAASALAPFAQPLGSLAAAAEPGKSLAVNLGLANIGTFNAGNANVGSYNLGFGNIGDFNLGAGNVGSNNVGLGNVGWGNFGFGNSKGVANIGFGNSGSDNFGFANIGVGNIGFANTGSGNIGIGLSGDNLTGIGVFNTGSGNVGLFNSGTGNVGFFNSGTGNWGLFNSGSYNTGVGNSGIGSTGWFNAGGFNTGLVNAGNYNTGSFNAGDANTGGFNPGSINTGWFNTGDINTGVANSGKVNTGAFISGNYSNGVLWRGNYEGLIGPFSSGWQILPEIPLSLDINGGVGAITIEPIHILPEIPININETLYLGPLVVPPINVPAISLGGTIPNLSIGPIKINPITLWPAQHIDLFDYTLTFTWPLSTITIPQIHQISLSPTPVPETLIGPIHINTGFSIPVTFAISTPALTLFPNGVSIPDTPLSLTLGVTAGTDAFTIPGFSIPEQPLPLTINVVGHIDALSTPKITIDNIPLHLHATGHAGPVDIAGVNIPASPGFGNSTTTPSSGFFNTGAGGVSGFGNAGAHVSGWFNQTPQTTQSLLGMASGYFNAGTLVSGIGNVGTHLSGVLSGGGLAGGNIGMNNIGLGNYGLGNVGFGNSGVAPGLMGMNNIGLGNAGSDNFGFANMGVGNVGFGNTGNGNIGIGLTGDNLTGIGGFNSGSGNVGLFNSGTDNVGFFNSGTGNSGLFNSGSHNTGIGNSGIANTGVFLTGDHTYAPGPVVFSPPTLFTISQIPIDLQVVGGIGPIHVEPIPVPEFNVEITGGFLGLREFTLPQITIPAIPIHVTGTVGLQGFHVSPTVLLAGLDTSATIFMNPVSLPSPFITIDQYGPPLGPPGARFPVAPFYLSITDLKINGPTVGGGNPGVVTPLIADFNLSTTPLSLFPNGFTVPDQTPVSINLSGGLDSITLFPGGLEFPENPVVSVTNFAAGTRAFTVFPQGFTVDRIPVNLHTTLTLGPFPFHWDYIPPVPANGPIPAVPGGYGLTSGLFPLHFTLTGDIGPISIPTTTVLDALHPLLTVTGNVEFGPFTVPDIPVPAIHLGLDGDVNLGLSAPPTTILSGLGITGGFNIPQIQIANISTQPAKLYMAVGSINTLFLFDFRDGIALNPIVIPGSSIPLNMDALELTFPGNFSQSLPLNLAFDSPASTVKAMVLHAMEPIDVSVDLEAISIPATVLPAIPLNVDLITPVGPVNIPIITTPGSETSTTNPSSDPLSGLFNGFGVPGLGVSVASLFDGSLGDSLISGFSSAVGIVGPNLGLSDLGVGNIGFANVGDFNLGSGNIGGFNLGAGNVGSNNVGLGNVGWDNVGFGNSKGVANRQYRFREYRYRVER